MAGNSVPGHIPTGFVRRVEIESGLIIGSLVGRRSVAGLCLPLDRVCKIAGFGIRGRERVEDRRLFPTGEFTSLGRLLDGPLAVAIFRVRAGRLEPGPVVPA